MSRRVLSKDEELTVLADCQRILKNPDRANDLVRYVALFFLPQPAEIPSDVKRLKSVQRAEKLGISIRFIKDAPPSGELRKHVYEHVFVYPLYKRNSERWAAPFGKCLSHALDRFTGDTAKEVTRSSRDDDEDDADWWKKGATC